MYFVYILKCADNTLYSGITTDLVRRMHEHNNSKLGAKYTRSRRPVSLVFFKKVRTRSRACSLEAKLKSFTRGEKENLLADWAAGKSVLR